MKLLRPRLFTVISLFSLCLCFAFIALWISSRKIISAAEPSTAVMQGWLARSDPPINLTNMMLEDAIAYVHDIGGGPPIEVDWKALDAAGMGPYSTCNVKSAGVTKGEMFVAILASVGPNGQITTEGLTLRISAKGRPWTGQGIQHIPDPNRPDPIYEYELKKRGGKPLPPLPKPLWEITMGERRYSVVRASTVLRLWSTPRDPAAIYQQEAAGKNTVPRGSRFAEFGGISLARAGWPMDSWTLALPYWLLIAVVAICPMIWVRRMLRLRRWLRRGQCLHCGYDLKATPQKCPECGREVASAQADPTASLPSKS